MAGCFGDSAEDRWKEKQTMGKDFDEQVYHECSDCGEDLDDETGECENTVCEQNPNYEEPEDEFCYTCRGSGEGMYEGTTCNDCGGGGSKPQKEEA